MYQGWGREDSNPHIQVLDMNYNFGFTIEAEGQVDLPEITKLLSGRTRIQIGMCLAAKLSYNCLMPCSPSGLLINSEVFFLPHHPCLQLHNPHLQHLFLPGRKPAPLKF